MNAQTINLTTVQTQLLQALTDRYIITHAGGKAIVLDLQEDVKFHNFVHFYEMYADSSVSVPRPRGAPKVVGIAEYWHRHLNMARIFPDGLQFKPGEPRQPTDPYYNTWDGWGVDPKQGSCKLLLRHIREVMCKGDKAVANWFMDWLAWGVRNPKRPVGSAVAVVGGFGAGKSILGDIMRDIYGQRHSFKMSDPKLLVGNHNGHLSGKLFIQVEEAFFGGDRQANRQLKDMITAPQVTHHEKFCTPVMVPNYHRFYMTANERHVLPLEPGERRWLVLETDDSFKDDRDYWDALWTEVKTGGKSAFHWYLLNRNIAPEFNRERPPMTAAKAEVIADSLDPAAEWYLSCLSAGEIPGVLDKGDWQFGFHGGLHFPTTQVHDIVLAALPRMHYAPSRTAITHTLKKAGVQYIGNSTPRKFVFPSLSEAREKFAQGMLGVRWDDV